VLRSGLLIVEMIIRIPCVSALSLLAARTTKTLIRSYEDETNRRYTAHNLSIEPRIGKILITSKETSGKLRIGKTPRTRIGTRTSTSKEMGRKLRIGKTPRMRIGTRTRTRTSTNQQNHSLINSIAFLMVLQAILLPILIASLNQKALSSSKQ